MKVCAIASLAMGSGADLGDLATLRVVRVRGGLDRAQVLMLTACTMGYSKDGHYFVYYEMKYLTL